MSPRTQQGKPRTVTRSKLLLAKAALAVVRIHIAPTWWRAIRDCINAARITEVPPRRPEQVNR